MYRLSEEDKKAKRLALDKVTQSLPGKGQKERLAQVAPSGDVGSGKTELQMISPDRPTYRSGDKAGMPLSDDDFKKFLDDQRRKIHPPKFTPDAKA